MNSAPDSTAVLLGNTYRDPASFGEERAATQALCSMIRKAAKAAR